MNRKHLVISGIAALLFGVALAAIPGGDLAVSAVRLEEPDNDTLRTMPEAEQKPQEPKSPFTGLPCPAEEGTPQELHQEGVPVGTPHRPVAVMLAGDAGTRPLSGIGTADLVVEMPVVTYGINRFMAVYTCGGEHEIGSVRSSRDDYIPLAAGFDAIYGHWGGSYLALNQLNRGVWDNVDALRNPYGAYFRKPHIPRPDNGFTTLQRMLDASRQLGYRTTLQEDWLPYVHAAPAGEGPYEAARVSIGYYNPYRVEWRYDETREAYRRFRAGREEIEATTGEQVLAGTVVTMRTNVTQRHGQYNDVRVIGEGEAVVYAGGRASEGRWRKGEALSAPLEFIDAEGEPIPFAPGPVWLEVIQTDTPVTVSPDAEETEESISN